MSDIGLGKIIVGEAFRDAVHVAVAPVTAEQKLYSGQWVRFLTDHPNFSDRVIACLDGEGIGIVDPFLRGLVMPGQRFYLWLIPGTITALRHSWTHPAFPVAVPETPPFVPDEASAIVVSRKWIEAYATEIGARYTEVMDAARNYVESGNYWTQGSRWAGQDSPPDEFWEHFQRVAEMTVPEEKRGSFFSCSC